MKYHYDRTEITVIEAASIYDIQKGTEQPPSKRQRKAKNKEFKIQCKSSDTISYFRMKLYSITQIETTTEKLVLYYDNIILEDGDNNTLETYKIPLKATIYMIIESIDGINVYDDYFELGFKGSALFS